MFLKYDHKFVFCVHKYIIFSSLVCSEVLVYDIYCTHCKYTGCQKSLRTFELRKNGEINTSVMVNCKGKRKFWSLYLNIISVTALQDDEIYRRTSCKNCDNQLILSVGDVPWAPWSPDLTHLDLDFLRYSTGEFSIYKPRNLDELKKNIIREIRNVTHDILRKVMETVVQGVRLSEQ